jgi:hypothetical protein
MRNNVVRFWTRSPKGDRDELNELAYRATRCIDAARNALEDFLARHGKAPGPNKGCILRNAASMLDVACDELIETLGDDYQRLAESGP